MDVFLEYFIGGTLRIGGSWGGPECTAYVPRDVHWKETATWITGTFLLFWLLNAYGAHKQLVKSIQAQASQVTGLDKMLAIIPAVLWLFVLYSKVKIHSLCNLFQPCHLSLVLNVIALCTAGPTSTCITIYTLPFVLGAWGALAIPDTSGLNYIEELHFFWQHYVLVAMPLYLLATRGFLGYQHATLRHLFNANLLIGLLHWIVFESINVTFGVNVNFFLCPTPGLKDLFATMDPLLLWPSYRTFLCLASIVLAMVFSIVYVQIVAIFFYLSGSNSLTKGDKEKDNKAY